MKTGWTILALVASLYWNAAAGAQDRDARSDWTDYRNERFGFSLRYPSDLFKLEKAAEAGDGHVFEANDGQARLLVGALPNDLNLSPARYQDYVARRSYADYKIDYRPVRGSWFVLSGEGGGKTFYEKVMFSCDGRLINSFAMIYPTDKRATFDAIVEGVEATFRPGQTCQGIAPDTARRTTRFPDEPSSTRRAARATVQRAGPRSALADRIARERGYDVIVVLRRTSPPYDERVVRGYASR